MADITKRDSESVKRSMRGATPRRWSGALVAGLVVIAGCFTAQPPPRVAAATALTAQCRIGATQTSVLVTEWPVAEKANLEAMMLQGAVAVEFSGCAMRVLPQCQLPGGYVWQQTSAATDVLAIENQAELFARLPLGALALSGELQRSGRLHVETTVAGQARLRGASVSDVPQSQECWRATHVVDAMSVGAFALTAGQEIGAGVSADAQVGSVGVRSSQQVKVLRRAGESRACAGTTADGPAAGCSSPIQVFLSAIPGRAEPVGPPGTIKANFESARANARWDVYLDDEATCTTPCDAWVAPSRPIVLRTRGRRSSELQIDRLDLELSSDSPVQITAQPTSQGKLATGITFTTLGGMAVVTGISLTAIGCTTDRDGMCTAGQISGLAGALVTLGAIYLILESGPRYWVTPHFGASLPGAGTAPVAGSF